MTELEKLNMTIKTRHQHLVTMEFALLSITDVLNEQDQRIKNLEAQLKEASNEDNRD